jgi:hypothetical protein
MNFPTTKQGGVADSASHSGRNHLTGQLTLALVTLFGLLAIAMGFGIGPSRAATFSQATADNTLSRDLPYSGGRLMAADPNGGYWTTNSSGAVASHGGAPLLGSLAGAKLNQPIVGMASTPDGAGYWLVASDGGIFSYGDAGFHGSTGNLRLNQPIVGMASTPDGAGYWLVASDGGIFSFGDAGFYGSLGAGGGQVLGIVVNPSDLGYTLIRTDGTVASFLQGGSGAQASGPIRQGAFVGSANPAGIGTFARATGTNPTIATEYLPINNGWAGMDDMHNSNSWEMNAWAGSGYQLSIGVPIIPTDASGAPVGSLAVGATGAYNGYFTTLAQTLVANGESSAYLRLGWEFDWNENAWTATTSTAELSFAAYFRQIVTAMRAVPGANFSFVWNPDAPAFNRSGYDVSLAYPGSAYVNYIGIDDYDAQYWVSPLTPSKEWTEAIVPSLTAAAQFAASEGEPLAICEWAIIQQANGSGFGDDPTYVNNMISWMNNPSNDVSYESYFDYNSATAGSMAITDFPNSLATFRAELG